MLAKTYQNKDLGILFVRLGLALVFFYHGWNKLAVPNAVTGMAEQFGISPVFLYVIATLELLIAASMVFGIGISWSGILAATMVVCINIIARPSFTLDFLDILLIGNALAVALTGSGAYRIRKPTMV